MWLGWPSVSARAAGVDCGATPNASDCLRPLLIAARRERRNSSHAGRLARSSSSSRSNGSEPLAPDLVAGSRSTGRRLKGTRHLPAGVADEPPTGDGLCPAMHPLASHGPSARTRCPTRASDGRPLASRRRRHRGHRRLPIGRPPGMRSHPIPPRGQLSDRRSKPRR